jgi:lipopolysaccharide transport system ATP-binding protein
MKLRLAFGVVAQLKPRALLIDEVLSVGDLRFQAKCAARVKQMQEGGAAVVMTSHYLEQVAQECDRVLWLQSGSVRMVGETAEVIAAYEDEMRSQTVARTPAGPEGQGDLELRRNRFGSQEVTVEAVGFGGPGGSAAELRSGDPLTVTARVSSHSSEPVDVHVAVALRRTSDGLVCADATSERGGLRLRLAPGESTVVSAAFARLDLVPGDYGVDVGVYEAGWEFAYDFHWSAYPLRVSGQPGGEGVLGAPVRWEEEPGDS